MRRALLLLAPLLVSATDPVRQAQSEAAAAEREAASLEQQAAEARGEADALRAEQAAAAAAIVAAETRIEAAELRRAALAGAVAKRRAELAAEQLPAALLLTGIAQMGRRPPLLALADRSSLQQLVTVRALLDSTLPVVRSRTAALGAELAALNQAAAQAKGLEAELGRERATLRRAQQRFAAAERQAVERSLALGGRAIAAGDVALGAAEDALRLEGETGKRRSAARLGSELAQLPAAMPRPMPPERGASVLHLDWAMPVQGRVLRGLAEISSEGVRSRGVTIESYRGATVVAPAAGKIAFAGPLRRREGVVILDHGEGWKTLLTEVRTTLPVGTAVAAGAPLGRALGDVTAELSRNGVPQPAALIARSSPLLSKTARQGKAGVWPARTHT